MTQDHLPQSQSRPAARAAWKLVSCLLLILFVRAQAAAQGGVAYVYDESGRLVAVIDPAGDTARYSYDAAGNLLSVTRRASSLLSILEFTPNGGPVGTQVIIYGTGFSATAGQNVVKFNGVAAVVSSATSTKLVTKVPAGATTGAISVATPAGAVSSSTPFTVGNLKAPTITGFTPRVGAPGAAVTVNGTNFRTTPFDNFLKLNTTEALASAATATTLNTSVPANAGSGRLSVATVFGKAVSTDDFFVPPEPYAPADVAATGRMSVGTSLSATVGAANKVGLILFDGLAGQRVTLQAGNVRVTSAQLTIYTPNRTRLADGRVNTGGGFIDPPPLPADGTYTILVDPDSNYTGSMTLSLFAAPDVAAPITPGGASVKVTTSTPGQNARLSFAGAAGQRVSLAVTGVTVSGTRVGIRHPNGTELGAVFAGTNGSFLDTLTLPAAGTYTILVDPSDVLTGSATLTLYNVPADPAAAATAGGPPVSVATTVPGQNARFTFSGTAGQRVSLDFGGVTIPNSTSGNVQRPDGTTLAFFSLFQGGNAFVDDLALSLTGTYTVFLDPQGTNTGGVTLALRTLTEVSGTITPGGASVKVTTTTPGQNARLSFTGAAGARVSLRVTGVTVSGTHVSLRRPDGTSQADIFVGTNGGFMDTQTLPAAGTYSILVDPSDLYTGSAVLTLYNVPADPSVAITVGGAAASVATTVPGQNARFTFNGTAGQSVTLPLWGNTIADSTFVTLLSPTNATVASLNLRQGEDGLFNGVALPATGAYRVFVDPQGPNTGAIRINNAPAATGTITPGGPSVRATVGTPGQNVRLTFSGTTGQRVSLAVFNVTVSFASVQITKPDGSALASVSVGSGGGFIDAQTLPVTGTYSVIFDPSGTSTGGASFTLYNVVDTTGTITPGGAPVAVNVTAPGQRAFLTFSGAGGQKVSLRVGGVTTTGARVAINRPDGLLTETFLGTAGAFIDTQTLPYAGTYTIVFDPQQAYTGGATLTLYNSNDVAAAITPGGPPLKVTINSPGQSARVTFSSAAGQKVSLGLSQVTVPDATRVTFLRPDGTVLTSTTLSQSRDDFTGSLPLPLAGTYTILINPDGAGTGSVTVTLYSAADVAAPIAPGGAPVTLTTTTAGQNARATFNGTAGQRVSLRVTGVTVSGSHVSINGPDGTELADIFVGTSGGFIDTRTLPSTGPYTILVDPSDLYTGSVTLTLYNVPADPAAAATAGAAPVSVTTSTPGQNARFTFNGAAGGQVSLNFSRVTIPDSSHVALFAPDGTQLVSASISQGAVTFVDALPLPLAGAYTLLVDPQGANTGGAALELYSTPDVSAAVTAGGAAVRVVTTVPGQNARLTFSGTAGWQVSVDLSQVTIPDQTQVTLSAPNGEQLRSTFVSQGSTGFIDTQTLPLNGTYTIYINPQGAAPGGITVRVLK